MALFDRLRKTSSKPEVAAVEISPEVLRNQLLKSVANGDNARFSYYDCARAAFRGADASLTQAKGSFKLNDALVRVFTHQISCFAYSKLDGPRDDDNSLPSRKVPEYLALDAGLSDRHGAVGVGACAD